MPGRQGLPPETREPKTIRFQPSEWAAISAAAHARGLDASTFARDLCLMALMVISTPPLLEAHFRTLTLLHGPGHDFSA